MYILSPGCKDSGALRRSAIACTHLLSVISDAKGIPHYGINDAPKEVDTLILEAIPKLYVKDIPATEELILKAKRLIVVNNDPTIWTPLPLGKSEAQSIYSRAFTGRTVDAEVWTTCMNKVNSHPTNHVYFNVNALAGVRPWIKPRARTPRALYYGAYRPGRAGAVARYLNHPGVDIVSTSKKFLEFAPLATLKERTPLEAYLPSYTASIYLEDQSSTRAIHSLPTRFFESASAGTAMLFPIECAKNVKDKYNIDVSPAMFKTTDQAMEIANDPELCAVLAKQQLKIAKGFTKTAWATLDRLL